MRYYFVIIVLLFSVSVPGQKSVASLNPKHKIALEQFLSKNNQYQFLPETAFDKESLKEVRKYSGKKLTPYYKVGDFNDDRVLDFAVILSKKGRTKEQEGVTSPPHKYIYPLVIVIFNGTRNGGYVKAFAKEIEDPLVCFLDWASVKKKVRLSYGVFATDSSSMFFTPVGKGYIIEYPEEF